MRKRIFFQTRISGLPHHQIDCSREAVPARQFPFHLGTARPREVIEFGFAAGFGLGPLRLDPALLLQPVQRRIERSLLDLKRFPGDQLNALGNCPPVLRFERESLQNQQIQGALNEIGRFTHYA